MPSSRIKPTSHKKTIKGTSTKRKLEVKEESICKKAKVAGEAELKLADTTETASKALLTYEDLPFDLVEYILSYNSLELSFDLDITELYGKRDKQSVRLLHTTLIIKDYISTIPLEAKILTTYSFNIMHIQQCTNLKYIHFLDTITSTDALLKFSTMLLHFKYLETVKLNYKYTEKVMHADDLTEGDQYALESMSNNDKHPPVTQIYNNVPNTIKNFSIINSSITELGLCNPYYHDFAKYSEVKTLSFSLNEKNSQVLIPQSVEKLRVFFVIVQQKI